MHPVHCNLLSECRGFSDQSIWRPAGACLIKKDPMITVLPMQSLASCSTEEDIPVQITEISSGNLW